MGEVILQGFPCCIPEVLVCQSADQPLPAGGVRPVQEGADLFTVAPGPPEEIPGPRESVQALLPQQVSPPQRLRPLPLQLIAQNRRRETAVRRSGEVKILPWSIRFLRRSEMENDSILPALPPGGETAQGGKDMQAAAAQLRPGCPGHPLSGRQWCEKTPH